MWTKQITINFTFSTRDWTQGTTRIESRYMSLNVTLGRGELDSQHNVIDDSETSWIYGFIQDQLHNCFLIDHADPAFSLLTGGTISFVNDDERQPVLVSSRHTPIPVVEIVVPNTTQPVGYRFDVLEIAGDPISSILDGFTIVNFVPTPEKIVEWLHCVITTNIGDIVQEIALVDNVNKMTFTHK